MIRNYGFAALALSALTFANADAAVTTYTLHNHSDGNQQPPPYGLILDDLIDDASYTFDFDYDSGSEQALMKLDYDDVAMTIHVHGRAYGGKDVGGGWDATQQGWVDIDFLYTTNVIMADNAQGDPGNDLYVTDEDLANTGTITLDGWGGDATFTLHDKTDGSHSFRFDNDYDPRDPDAAANPMISSGAGWLMIDGVPLTGGCCRDWLFFAEVDAPSPVSSQSWGQLKGTYR
ncbi:MAG: hypothetical protein R3B81_03505 [bacterium]